ncbi:32 kDa beta-galactoside-binding lectin [Parasteatoda tepidariorum]|uniref:32 kDa beta-galactoside-binding lectin n=1 Tax=Parasteatoda tepidariorum TaxID=114398 RepID=UPI00077FC15F|nr:32 kDa beta-galactoside-binding lectin [Parasteatoda tepidariorum]
MTVADLVAPLKKEPGLHYKNPRFPLKVKLANKLEVGTKIHIHGAVFVTASRFAVNLKDAECDANNYFHFNPRLDEGCVVRNARLDESWGDEEREGDMPFEAGQPFLITITATDDDYDVEVNGNPFAKFNHREGLPFANVSHIAMWGDVTIYGIYVPFPSINIPLNLRIPKNAFVGDIYLIEGHVPGGADRFHVNLQCGEREDAEILYHFNPRFGDNALVCNSRCADSWGDEERFDGLPVASGENFSLCIVVSKDGFIPMMNNQPLPTFNHRVAYSGACTINVEGDVELKKIVLDCPPARMPPRVPDIDIDTFEEITTQALRGHAPVSLPLIGHFGSEKVIYISGKVDNDPSRFAINLQCGESPDDDIAMHINPRWDDFEGSVLVFNSREADAWGEELRKPNPIVSGEEVDIYIIGCSEGFSILVNGEVVEEIEHRMDISRITHISLDGSIMLYRVLAN